MTWSDIALFVIYFPGDFKDDAIKLRHTHLAHWTHKYISIVRHREIAYESNGRTTCAIRIPEQRRISTTIIKWAIRREEIAHKAKMERFDAVQKRCASVLYSLFHLFIPSMRHFCGLPQRFLLPADRCKDAKTKTKNKDKIANNIVLRLKIVRWNKISTH